MISSRLKSNFTLSPSYSFHKSSYHKSFVLSQFIFRGHTTQEPSSGRVTYFILRAYIVTGVSHSQHRKKSGEFWKKCRWMDRKGRNKLDWGVKLQQPESSATWKYLLVFPTRAETHPAFLIFKNPVSVCDILKSFFSPARQSSLHYT